MSEKENIFIELRREQRKSQLKSDIIDIIETKPEVLKKMHNQRLKDLSKLYDENINTNELKIRKLKNKLQRLKQNNI